MSSCLEPFSPALAGATHYAPNCIRPLQPASALLPSLLPALAGDYSGSPSFTDRQVYSPEPTPFHCPTCNVYCTSERLLEVGQASCVGRPGQCSHAFAQDGAEGNRIWVFALPVHQKNVSPVVSPHLFRLAAGAPARAKAPAARGGHRLTRWPPLLPQVSICCAVLSTDLKDVLGSRQHTSFPWPLTAQITYAATACRLGGN